MKPLQHIADDCDIAERSALLKTIILGEPPLVDPDGSVLADCAEIVRALYQRVELLEESAAQHTKLESDFLLKCCALEVSHDQTRHAERRAEIANEKFERVVELHSRDWRDRPTPEDEDIDAAHPVNSDRHETYMEAMRLVGDRHSKSSLVAMVNWLLTRIEDLEAKRA